MSTFEEAADKAKTLKNLSQENMLELYGLFKQANLGDNTTTQPWQVQMEAYAKWTAWNANLGMSQDDAKKNYIDAVAKFSAAQ